ncbi:MAG: hypothetical protein OMM_10163 [Candidatus Magnetoglobus multicellularis str. Araruama]|uniref:Chemotaxis receptor methyltransferase CheR N-terminal domain-containing protein n=2 Tax=Candidatus Magnetoglobus multicellularis str. Araruama TaxID=890399 RepID=A0A1V1P1Q0_9BACT|nr:MAG: hypothetical protein OMM_10163 [Candidatus Magnetoglobus multicellularis str. Araruama]
MNEEIKNIEIQLLLEGIYRIYGYDFRNYSLASLKRRLKQRMAAEKVDTISGLQERIFHQPESMQALFYDLSINVTEFFRNPFESTGLPYHQRNFRKTGSQTLNEHRICPRYTGYPNA